MSSNYTENVRKRVKKISQNLTIQRRHHYPSRLPLHTHIMYVHNFLSSGITFYLLFHVCFCTQEYLSNLFNRDLDVQSQ